MKLLLVAGARPQFVKAASLLPALRARHEVVFVHTGQHPDAAMVEAHFAGLGLPAPDRRLDPGPGDRAARLAHMVEGLARCIDECRPARVLVMGDTDSTLAGALAASLRGAPLAHVEAGARSGERDLPEERNRIVADELSDLFFCSTPDHATNLAGRDGVHVTGDVMADVLLAREGEIRARAQARAPAGPYGVLTLHRAATADDAQAVRRVLEAVGRAGVAVLFPRHPRTRAGARAPAGIELTGPQPYLDFLAAVAGATFVATDSGGVQKEAYLLGVPCITLREATEWGATVEAGWNVLAGTDTDRIERAVRAPPRAAARPPLFGDGHAAERIAALLEG